MSFERQMRNKFKTESGFASDGHLRVYRIIILKIEKN